MNAAAQTLVTETRRASLVAFYRRQPRAFVEIVESAQAYLRSALPAGSYLPYSAAQLHATIVRLGTSPTGVRAYEDRSRWLATEVREGVKASSTLPFSVQFGGYAMGVDYGFESQGRHPYVRSFEIRDDRVVLIGWPTARDCAGMTPLGALRTELGKRGFVHKYSNGAREVDNDMYVTLGLIVPGMIPDKAVSATTAVVRSMLASRRSIVELNVDDLAIVSYCDRTLPVGSTKIRKL